MTAAAADLSVLPSVDGPEAIPGAVATARAAQKTWAALSVRARAKLIKRARREMVLDRDTILTALESETGKPRFDVVGELMGLCLETGYLARRANGWLRTQRVSARPLFGKRGRIVFKPRGVVGVIAPWNAPLILALGDAIPALLAGNAVLIKPSEVTPHAVSAAVAAMNRVLPEGVLQVVLGEGDAGAALVDNVDMVCVTGSTRTGRSVMERASQRLTPVLLELGGKDPMLVLSDADLDRAARAATWGGCMMSGQVCTSVERIYVVEPVAEAFKAKLVERMQELRWQADVPSRDYGRFISPRQVEIVEEQLRDARVKGATVLTGGTREEGPDGAIFFAPTVVADTDHSMTLMTEETFGPVVSVMVVRDEQEAIRMANDCEFGLNASVFTRNTRRGIEVAQQIESGNACVNECVLTPAAPALPFGGVKGSGVGFRHGGAEGLRQFCVRQSILTESRRRKTEPVWFPYTEKRTRFIEKMMGLLFGR